MANFEELTNEERFLKFKEELKLIASKFKNSEDLKAAKFSLIVFEDLNYLAEKFLENKNNKAAKETVRTIVSRLNEAKDSLIEGDVSISPIAILTQLENSHGSYLTNEIKKNFCAANRINIFKKIFFSDKLKDEALRNYLDKLSDSRINEIGEPIDQEDLDKIMILRQKIDNNFGDGAI
ncbi:MAG: hypothetical protein PHR57_02420 [Patescibacteria group bacterium]|nr:hypothetical protein [Patescibacteria group bacterium]